MPGTNLTRDEARERALFEGRGVPALVDTAHFASEWPWLARAARTLVDDLAASYDYCRRAGCTITSEPRDEPWGHRVFECLDPHGYQWELSEPVAGDPPTDSLEAARASWFDPPPPATGREPTARLAVGPIPRFDR